jgi:polysaccharide biosynthesis transport protein
MLQISKPSTIADRSAAPNQFVSPAELYALVTGFLGRRAAIIGLTTLAMLFLAGLYIMTAPGLYTGHAVIVIDTHKSSPAQQLPVSDVPMDTGMVDTQIEILMSENVALSVIKEFQLDKDPEFVSPRRSIFGRAADLVMGMITFFIPSEEPSLPLDTVASGQASKHEGPPISDSTSNVQSRLLRKVLGVFQSRMKLKRVGLTYAIEIDFQSTNPDRAAQIANGLAEAYAVDALDAKYTATRRASAWLQDRLKELRSQSVEADRAVVEFKAKNNIVESGGRLMNEQQLAELNSALIQARAQSAETQARLDRIKQVLSDTDSNIAEAATATVTDSLHNDVIIKLRQKYLDYAQKEADWSRRFGAAHLAAVNMRNQMAEIRNSIADELRRIAETYKSDYEIAKKREASVEASLAAIVAQSQTTNEAQVGLRDLDSKAQSYRALYDNFLQNYMESVQKQSIPSSDARVITRATRPYGKSSPKIPLVLGGAIFIGLFLGCGIGIWREVADRTFRTSKHVEENLGATCLGIVPLLHVAKPSQAKLSEERRERLKIIRDASPMWASVDSPFSRFAEAVRGLKVAADLSKSGDSHQVIGITSSVPGEGKSTIAAALAASIARGGRRVMLIDCDLRNPSLSAKLAPGAEKGIVEILHGEAWLDSVAWCEGSIKLTFLPAVISSRLTHSSEILASEAARRVFEVLREAYDYVIVDLPPLAPVVDVRAMSHLVDSFIFVVEWGRTKIDVADHALDKARSVYDNLLGVVLNKADMKTIGRYEGNRRNYYFDRRFARYGYRD